MSLPDTDPHIPATASAELPAKTRLFKVRSYGLTDVGRVRRTNEDHFAIVQLARRMSILQTNVPQSQAQYSSAPGHLFVIADGMGGHECGEVASALSVLTIEGFLLNALKRFLNLQPSDNQLVLKEFQKAIVQADARILEEAAQHPEMIGMGTTLTMAFAVNWTLLLAHAGDSRCYLLSKRELQQMTRDHTLVAEMVRHGLLDQEQASRHPSRHVVTNVLGGHKPGVQVEMHKLELEPGDVLLLCSDGLSEMISNDQIASTLAEEAEPRRACERLVAKANEKGGRDNITVIVASFEEE